MAEAAIGYAAKGFRLWPGSGMADKLGKDRLGHARQTHGSTGRSPLGIREKGTSAGLHGGAGGLVRLTNSHRTMMFSSAAATRRKRRVLGGREQRRAYQRKAEQGHQQYCRHPTHSVYCTAKQEIFQRAECGYCYGKFLPEVVSMNRPCFTPFVAISALARLCTSEDLPRTRTTSRQLS